MEALPVTPPGTEDSFAINCPLDGAPMTNVKAGNFTIDRCDSCGGLWFDMAELQRLIAHGMRGEDFDTLVRKRGRISALKQLKCPRDDTMLKDVPDPTQPHIIYHQCSTCGGLFLQAGDLCDLTHLTLGERVKNFFRM
jgi:Zn-finger nucleic acid-binding protein